MKYSLTFFIAFSLLTSIAQPVKPEVKSDYDSFTLKKQLTILVRSDTLIIKKSMAKIDTFILRNEDSAISLIKYFKVWDIDTADKQFIKLTNKLKTSSKIDISKKILTDDTIPSNTGTDLEIVEKSNSNELINQPQSLKFLLIGIVGGFIFFILLRLVLNSKKTKSRGNSVAKNSQSNQGNVTDTSHELVPEQKIPSQITLHSDILVELKKRKIEIPKKATINDFAKKLLATLSELEKKQDEDLKTLEGLQEEKGQFENEKLNLTNQIAQIQEQVKQLTIEKTDLTDKMRSLKELAAQDEQVVFKALVWINRADDDIHNQISQGDVRGANQRLVSSALNGLLLFQSYLEYRRKLSRTSSKDVAPPTQKSVEMDANLRILMGEQVDLKQPGPGISDAPPLTSHLREVAKEHGITEITPFGYDGYKIKS